VVIALDIDDTITLHPAFFAAMSQAMRAAGHTIVIITLRESESLARQDLASMGIVFDRIVCATPDALAEHGYAWKATVCRELGVDVFFEDSPRILSHVDPRTLACLVTQPEGRASLAGVRRLEVATTLMEQVEVDAERLMGETPPVWLDARKRAIAARTCPPEARYAGRLRYTRWALAAMPDGDILGCPAPSVQIIDGPMIYDPQTPRETAWHMNFADPDLFVAYGSDLFAQDEWQVVEHPALGALREWLMREDREPRTACEAGPTPILIEGVERRCEITVAPRQTGRGEAGPVLYGCRFSRAPVDTVLRATRLIEPPTVTNIIALAAPACGSGVYRARAIAEILRTALTGFAAAVRRSPSAPDGTRRVVIHTGLWGCGAFGGNPVLMTIIQIVAARMAGVSELRLFVPEPVRRPDVEHGVRLLEDLCAAHQAIVPSALIRELERMGFEWGESDGN
jgi:hypothetical protein